MNDLNEIKQLISEARNIYLIPSANEPEAAASALALFYTLKELQKNAKVIIDDLPEKLSFLVPSLDFITTPQNFVISIPRVIADVSQIYYEKTEENLKIHLTLEAGRIKKENVSFYVQESKPDLTITIGMKEFKKHLENEMDSFGFLINSPILNIDNKPENEKFGKINLLGQKSLPEVVLEIIKSIDEKLVKNNVADSLLAGLVLSYENFKSQKTGPEVFELVADLIKRGAKYQQIIDQLQKTTQKETGFLEAILKNSRTNGQVSVAVFDSEELENFNQPDALSVVEKIKTIGLNNDLLVLWKSHASELKIKGFFYSKKPALVSKIATNHQGIIQKDLVFLSLPGSEINLVKDKILKSF